MTSRPVFERPRLMRTLLCLFIGVLALLWRAVPVFSWNPSSCTPNAWHSHTMQSGDTAALGAAYYVTKQCPNDAFSMQWSPDGLSWYRMSTGTCYICSTWIRIVTYGDPGEPYGHEDYIRVQFCAMICQLHHDDADEAFTGSYYHSPGHWNAYGNKSGSDILMWRYGSA